MFSFSSVKCVKRPPPLHLRPHDYIPYTYVRPQDYLLTDLGQKM